VQSEVRLFTTIDIPATHKTDLILITTGTGTTISNLPPHLCGNEDIAKSGVNQCGETVLFSPNPGQTPEKNMDPDQVKSWQHPPKHDHGSKSNYLNKDEKSMGVLSLKA
jgi:hypothetical protein